MGMCVSKASSPAGLSLKSYFVGLIGNVNENKHSGVNWHWSKEREWPWQYEDEHWVWHAIPHIGEHILKCGWYDGCIMKNRNNPVQEKNTYMQTFHIYTFTRMQKYKFKHKTKMFWTYQNFLSLMNANLFASIWTATRPLCMRLLLADWRCETMLGKKSLLNLSGKSTVRIFKRRVPICALWWWYTNEGCVGLGSLMCRVEEREGKKGESQAYEGG